jgi:hypothetical protein
MRIPIKFGYAILVFILIIPPLLAACDKDETGTDPAQNEKMGLGIGSAWVYNEIHNDKVNTITAILIGEELINDDNSYIIDFQYDTPTYWTSSGPTHDIQVLGHRFWHSTTTMAVNGSESTYRTPTKARIQMSNYRKSGYFPERLWIGQSWTYDTLRESDLPGQQYPVITWEAKIVAIEEITVPAGMFQCFKIEHTTIASNGQPIAPAKPERIDWLAPDVCFNVPVKREFGNISYGPFIWELVSYSLIMESSG